MPKRPLLHFPLDLQQAEEGTVEDHMVEAITTLDTVMDTDEDISDQGSVSSDEWSGYVTFILLPLFIVRWLTTSSDLEWVLPRGTSIETTPLPDLVDVSTTEFPLLQLRLQAVKSPRSQLGEPIGNPLIHPIVSRSLPRSRSITNSRPNQK
jgi:hypothetical protein